MSDIQSFREAVESFIGQHGWTPTRFGRQMAGDPLFVFDLREGREPRSDTRTRILKAMADEAEAPAAPPLWSGRNVFMTKRKYRYARHSRSGTDSSSCSHAVASASLGAR